MKFSKAFILAFFAFISASQGKPVLDTDVNKQLGLNGKADIIVRLTPFDFTTLKADHFAFPATNSKEEALAARGARRQAVYEVLKEYADATQQDILGHIRSQGLQGESLWIDNSIFIKDAPEDLVLTLSNLDNIKEIVVDKEVAWIEAPIVGPSIEAPNDLDAKIEWNIKQINAHSSWPIVDGEGITVANIDTGVFFTHEALVDSYRGTKNALNGTFVHDYNWFDPRKKATAPSDTNGHGTHTMGTIIGKTASKNYHIGVSHGARWIGAKGCAGFGCSTYDLTASGQWVMCPTKINGTEVNCHLGADVVSNSWGGGRGDTMFKATVDAWRAAGIIPVFSQGNSGSRCASANSPADLSTVIGVGSSNIQYRLSSFSSRGPGIKKEHFSVQKPDITAPGEAVISSYPDGKYRALSGTSMAGPHIAGVVTLLLAANPAMEYNEIYKLLTTTAMRDNLLEPAGGITTCANVTYKEFPNYFYGYGLCDSLPAVKKAKDGRKKDPERPANEQFSEVLASLLRIALKV